MNAGSLVVGCQPSLVILIILTNRLLHLIIQSIKYLSMVEASSSVAQTNSTFEDPIYKKFEGILKGAKKVSKQ